MPLAAPPRVFLSYARKDGEEFATALRRRLVEEEPEITIWQDRAEMEGGVGWWTQIDSALDQVRFLVIVVTPHAITSEFTAREWRCARQRGVVVYPVKGVPDAEFDFTALPNWMRKVHFFDLGRFVNGEWRDVKEWDTFTHYLKSDRQSARLPFMAPDLPRGFVPRHREFDELLQLVISPTREQPVAITTALHGAGGYGKTTLATALCHDERVLDAFDDGVLWTSLGQTPHLVDELTKLYEALTGQSPGFVDVTQASARLADRLEHRRCLIVIDDVWERAHLEPFLKGGRDCARLLTTRRLDLLSGAPRVRVDEMTTAESIRVLTTTVGQDCPADHRLAALARRLGEWPLLLNLAAVMIRRRLDRGDSVDGAMTYLERAFDKRGVTAFDQGSTEQRDEAVRRTVAVSMELLSAEDGERFQQLAIFPEEIAIPLATLERLWGLDDVDTAECAQRLDNVSLLRLDLQRCAITLHDVMRGYLLQQVDNVPSLHAQFVAAYGDIERPPDLYAWRWLPYHLQHAGQTDDLRSLLLRPTWLCGKLRAVGPHALIADFDLIPGDCELDVIEGAIRLSTGALAASADQFWEQLLGRLPPNASERLESFKSELALAAPRSRLRARWPNLQPPGGSLLQTLTHQGWVLGAILLPDGRLLSWDSAGTLRVWTLATGEGLALLGHEGSVNGALSLPDGRVLSWDGAGTLRAWNLATGESRSLIGHEGPVTGARALSDGRALSWSHDGTLRVWDLATGEGRVLRGHTSWVSGALLLPGARALSWSLDGTLRVWNLATGEGRVMAGALFASSGRERSHDGTPQPWYAAMVSRRGPTGLEANVKGALLLPDERALSWNEDWTLSVWDLTPGVRRILIGHFSWVYGALLLTDERALSWSDDRTLRVWELATGEGRTLTGHEERINGALQLPDGRALSWSDDRTLRVWDLATGKSRALIGHRAAVKGALLLPDGRALSWSSDGTPYVWDLTTGDGRALTGHGDSVSGALSLPDGRAVSWSWDERTVRVWNLATGEARALAGHEGAVEGAVLLRNGRALSWGEDGTLRMWDLMTGEGRVLTGHEGAVNGALLLPDRRAVSWGEDGTLRIWDPMTGEGRVLTSHEGAVRGALLLPDGRALSWGEDGTLRVWEPATGEARTLTGHSAPVRHVLVLPGGRVLSYSRDRALLVWDLATGEGKAITDQKDFVDGGLVLPDGRALMWSDDDTTLRIRDLTTDERRALAGHEDSIDGALPLPDGRALSWSRDRTLRVWDLATGESVALTGHQAQINGAMLLPDGRVLSWSGDMTLRVWDLATGETRTLAGHEDSVTGALLMADGRILSWSDDHSLRIADLTEKSPGLVMVFCFDATPTVVIPASSGGLLVGDALGRIHFLEYEDSSCIA